MLSEYLFHPAILLPLACVVYFILSFARRHHRLPNIPVIGARKGDWFPLLQAKWRNTRDPKTALKQAHSQYRDVPVILPVAGSGDMVMLPHREIDFVTNQPDSVLSFNERAFQLYQIDYTFTDPTVPRVTLHGSLLRTALTPQIGNLLPVLADEAAWALERYWGTDTNQWREICVYKTMSHIAGGVGNRAFVGLPYCRDPELVNNGAAFAEDIPLTGAILNNIWKPLRPLLAPLITIPNRIHTRRFRKILISEINRRLQDYDARLANPSSKTLPPEPNDFLQWSIHQAKAHDDPFMSRPSTLADRILIVNFAAIHTTSFSLTWALFDFIASSPSDLISSLRSEAATVLAANNNQWTKRTLAQLTKLDSAMRESARLSSILSVGLGRVVIDPAGLITPSGVHLPPGTHVCVPVFSVMRDEEVYPDAETFLPDRWIEKAATEGGNNTLPATGPDFLAFGHGKHACPGRFFAAAEMKVIMAMAVLSYDFERIEPGDKPEGPWFGITRIPPMEATVRVRRRGATMVTG